jgi:uncharacterized damage-inducible protein DinB
MDATRIIRDLFEHMAWADAEVWRAVLATPPAAADLGVFERFRHIHMVQRAFLGAWRDAFVDPRGEVFEDVLALARWAREYHADAATYLDGLDAATLDAPVVLPWAGMMAEVFGREIATPTLGETLLQVPSHTTYHRGQVNADLRRLGGEPPLVDYIAWVWFGRPEPTWPE